MNGKHAATVTVLAGLLFFAVGARAASTVYPFETTILKEGVTDGYVIFAAQDGQAHLIDLHGNDVHTWPIPGCCQFLIRPLDEPGRVLAKSGGDLVEFDWFTNPVWSYSPPEGINFHHDWLRLPNGNTLILADETVNIPELSPEDVLVDVILEVTPGGSIVWEWHVTDHLDEFGFPQERFDLIFERGGDITHFNTVSPIPENISHVDPRFQPGNIIFSARQTSSVGIIDPATSEIVWVVSETTIGQHTPHMLPDDLPGGGNILIFDNGGAGEWSLVPNRFHSRVVEIDPVTGSLPFVYTAESSGLPKETFFGPFVGSVQRFPNGNTLVNEGTWGRVFEITSSGEIVWEYVSPHFNPAPTNLIYRAYKVPLEWAAPFFEPDLAVSGSTDAQVGSDAHFFIQVDNIGPDPAVDTTLSLATPEGTTFQSIVEPAGWNCLTPSVGGTGPIVCTVSELSAGTAAVIDLAVAIGGPCGIDGTTISASVTTSSLGTDLDPGNNSATIEATVASETLIPDLVVTPIDAGENLQLDWPDGAPECGYRVLRSLTPTGGFVDLSGPTFDTSYVDLGAGSSGEDYYYRIQVD